MKDGIEAIIGVLLVLAVIVGSIGFAVSASYFEAKAFNECTGGNATYFTALFTELRVENCNK